MQVILSAHFWLRISGLLIIALPGEDISDKSITFLICIVDKNETSAAICFVLVIIEYIKIALVFGTWNK